LALDALQTHGHDFYAVVKMLRENDEDAYRSSLFPIPCPILILSQFLISDWLRNQRPDLKGEFAMHRLEPKFALYLINERRTANRDRVGPAIISPRQLSGKRVALPISRCAC